MTRSLRHRRRAERFAQLLDEASGARRQHLRSPLDEELSELVAVRRQLVETAPPALDPEFRSGLRAMLVATAEREGIGVTAPPAPEPRRAHRPGVSFARPPRTRTAVIAGVAVGAVAFAGMSTASENAVPGDTLYGVKRSTERAQLALASSDVGRAQLYLDFAQTRLAEARSVTTGLDRVLSDMDRETAAGVKLLTTAADNRRDPAALDPIDRFVIHQREALDELRTSVTGADRARVETSLAMLDEVAERSSELRHNLDLSCPSATSVDTLGPLPSAACVALPPPSQLDGPGDAPAPDQSTEQQPDSGDPAQRGEAPPEDDDLETPRSGPDQPAPGGTGDDPGATDPADDEQSDEEDEPETADEGGLLSSLNRLLGNLFGG